MKKKLSVIILLFILALFTIPIVSQKLLHYSIDKMIMSLEKRGISIYNPIWIDEYGKSIFKAQINFKETELKSEYGPLVLLKGKLVEGNGFWGNSQLTSNIDLLLNHSTIIFVEPQAFLNGFTIQSQKISFNQNIISKERKSYLESNGGNFQMFQVAPFTAEFSQSGLESEIHIPIFKINNFLELNNLLFKDSGFIKQEITLEELKTVYSSQIKGLFFNWQLKENKLISEGKINSLFIPQLSQSFPIKFKLEQDISDDDLQAMKANNPLLILLNKFSHSQLNPEYLLEIGNKDLIIRNNIRKLNKSFLLELLNGATLELNPNFVNQAGLQMPLMFFYGSPIFPTNAEGRFIFKINTENGEIKLLKSL